MGVWCPLVSLQAALPAIKASLTVTGKCENAIFKGRCLLDGKAISEWRAL